MIHRALTLISLLVLVGCAAVHDGGPHDSGAPAQDDGGDATPPDPMPPDPMPDGGGLPCGGECFDSVCDEASGACVECVSAGDCAGETPSCVENQCVTCGADDMDCGAEPPPPDPDPDTTPPPPPPPDPEPPAPEPPPEPPTGARPFHIRFATYNVRTSNLNNAAWRDFHEGWDSNDAARMHRVADEIAGQGLTVVAAQEMRANERDAVLWRLRSGHRQDWGHTSSRQPALDDTAVLYLRSVWRKVRETHFVIPLQGDLRDRYQVGVLLTHRATGRAVWFYSVHFAAGGAAGADERAEAARRTVASIRERAIATDRPFVLGGDFNATAGSRVGDIFRAAGFMKYTRNAADRRINNGCKTFNGNAGWEGRQQCPGGEASHIDHVWVSRSGMQVETYRVTATRRTSRASDHNPLTTILERR